MPDKPEIEKLRVLHDLQTQFDVPDAIRSTLETQLSADDQDRIDRFVGGFKIEDWFEWIFSAMPWALLIHGLDQQQFPTRSKKRYQVPDFLTLVETTSLSQQPLLIEIKRVPHPKTTLKLQSSQVELCANYASALNMPLVYAIYWEKLNGWTLNTPDTFESKSSTRKMPMTTAFEFDCSLILGDVSYFVPQSLTRVSCFDNSAVSESSVRHEQYGGLVSDVAILGNKCVEMTSVESAAIDSMMTMKTRSVEQVDGTTKLLKASDDNYMLKLSSWITRHLAIFNATPSEEYANVSANVITDLMQKLDCPSLQMFPSDRTDDLKQLQHLFMMSDTVE